MNYCNNFITEPEEVDLLHEVIMLIGYYSMMNKEGTIMLKSESPVIKKLFLLPIQYIKEKKLTDILFPTIISMISFNK